MNKFYLNYLFAKFPKIFCEISETFCSVDLDNFPTCCPTPFKLELLKHKARDILNVILVIYLYVFVLGINHQVQERYRLSVS